MARRGALARWSLRLLRWTAVLAGLFLLASVAAVFALLVIGVWAASGIYRVQPDEEGVVLRFGAYNRNAPPGLNYHIPWPVETALTPRVTTENLVFIGFRSADASAPRAGAGREVADPEADLGPGRHQRLLLGGRGGDAPAVDHHVLGGARDAERQGERHRPGEPVGRVAEGDARQRHRADYTHHQRAGLPGGRRRSHGGLGIAQSHGRFSVQQMDAQVQVRQCATFGCRKAIPLAG